MAAPPNFKVTFSGSGPSVTVYAAEPNINAPVTVPGVVHRTQGGGLVSYQVGPRYFEATLSLPSLRGADKTALVAFHAANWGLPFTYTDENGNTFTAQFLDASLPLVKMQRDLWKVALHLNLSSVLL